MDKFLHITIGELLEIKKISKMQLKEGFEEMKNLKDRYNLTHKEVQNLVGLANNFNPTLILK